MFIQKLYNINKSKKLLPNSTIYDARFKIYFSSVSLIENFLSNIVFSCVELFAYGLTMILEVLGLNGRSERLEGSLFYSYEIRHYIALIISLGTT